MKLITEISNLLEQIGIEPPKKACVCPECGAKVEAPYGVPCREIQCPKCGAIMIRDIEDGEEESEIKSEAKVRAILKYDASDSPVFTLVVDGNEIFKAFKQVDAIAKLRELNCNPPADEAVQCAIDKGECEVEIEMEG